MEIIDLPEDLLFQILMFLPIKTLLCCRSVSKFWYSLISSSNFIDNHSQICEIYNSLLKTNYIRRVHGILSLHVTDEQIEQDIETYEFPFGKEQVIKVVSCANGLICFTKMKVRNLCIEDLYPKTVIWNPSIRKIYIVPEFIQQFVNGSSSSGGGGEARSDNKLLRSTYRRDTWLGFGYDVLSNDYKVVQLIYNNRLDDNDQSYVAVFSLATKSWKVVASCVRMRLLCASCNVGRFVYRRAIVWDQATSKRYSKIFCFDLSTEEFTEIEDLPEPLKQNPNQSFTRLRNYRDSLGLLLKSQNKSDLWVLREDGVGKSWMKLFSVHVGDGNFKREYIVGFTMKGAILVVNDHKLSDLLVSPVAEDDDQIVEILSLNDTRFWSGRQWKICSFRRSLVLLNEGVDQQLLDF